jgi:signal transduction histidine kinase
MIFRDQSLRNKFIIILSIALMLEAIALVFFFHINQYSNETNIFKTISEGETRIISHYEGVEDYKLKSAIVDSLIKLEHVKGAMMLDAQGKGEKYSGEIINLKRLPQNGVKRKNFNRFLYTVTLKEGYSIILLIDAGFWKNSLMLIFVPALFILIILGMTFNFFDRLIIAPLNKIINIFENIKNTNDFSIRVRPRSKDEIGKLYLSFNDLIQQLQRRDIGRTRAESKMRKSKERAEQADKLKGLFLANMSHEIRTPMNSIIGFSNLLVDQDLSIQKRKEYIDLIHISSASLMKLIDDIIDISKIEAGQLSINKSSINLNKLFEDIYASYKNELLRIGKEKVSLKFTKPEGEETIFFTDEFRIRQVLSNLLNNSVKFTEKGSIEFGFAKQDNIIRFFVNDTGIGIPVNERQYIFEPFRKGENSYEKLYRGTGLGLAISHRIVDLLGGEMGFHSAVGKGSRFWFDLPGSTSAHTQETKLLEPSIGYEPLYLTGKTILIAEDEETNFILVDEILKNFNAKTIWVKDGKKAVEACKSNPDIDLVLMDVKMPIMDGYTATSFIKELTPDLPVVALTAHAFAGEREKAKSFGCDDYLSKPILQNELINKINPFLK